MIKPKRLGDGGTIGIISPSGPLLGIVSHRVDNAIKNLTSLGYKIKFGKNSKLVTDYTAGNIKQRIQDIEDMFLDKEVEMIMCAIGGFHSNQLINNINYQIIKDNPKIFIGFSDISVLHFAIYTQTGLTTFYGPALLTQFGDYTGIDKYTLEYFQKAITRTDPIGIISPSNERTDELLNRFSKEDLNRPRTMQTNKGHERLKNGIANGELLGGCVTSILHLRGTKYRPDFNKKIFFWEIPESSGDIKKGESYSRVASHLADLKLSNVFDEISGMIIGRPKGYSDKEIDLLKNIVLECCQEYHFPILFNVDIGHTDPIGTYPLGLDCTLNSKDNIFSINESGVI